MLFYKIGHTVKLALLELHRFGLAGQCRPRVPSFAHNFMRNSVIHLK